MSVVGLVSTYTPSEEFGGPARIFHMRTMLERRGHRVVHIVVDSGGPRGSMRGSDLRVSLPIDHSRGFDPIYHDIRLGEDAVESKDVRAQIIRHVADQGVELFVVEQPFLARLVDAVRERHPAPVVYSCQNIEFTLR